MKNNLLCPLCFILYCLVQSCNNSHNGYNHRHNSITKTLDSDSGSRLTFFGDTIAELYSRELNESLQGVLKYNFVSVDSAFPIGFVHASPVPQGWSNTFWTRDGGTFLRELVHWNYIEHACRMTECLMKMVARNKDGAG
jgi:hypothetical protein